MKERITITLNKSLLDDIDNTIDNETIKNRSHAIELLLAKSLKNKNISKAILLAGGTTQIGLGKNKLSPCCSVVNSRRVIEHIILSLKRNGIGEFIIVGTKDVLDMIRTYLDPERFNVELKFIEEKNRNGTAGAIRIASEEITGPVVVCNTNSLFQIDINEMFNFHKNSGSLATIALTTTPDVRKFGVVMLNGTKVFSFDEKPSKKIPSNIISAGCYIIEPEILDLIPEGYSKIEEDVFPKLAKQEKLSGFMFYGKWNRIGSKEDIERAENEW